jgi:hypothetical protein
VKKVVSRLEKTWYFGESASAQTKISTEKFKVLRVIGEDLGQIVAEKLIKIEAIKIDHVNAELREVRDVIFKGKVVKEGLLHVQVFYVNLQDAVLHTACDIPFTLIAPIPNLEPNSFIEVQNHVLDITPNFHISYVSSCGRAEVEIKVVAHILTKVSEWVQRDLVTGVDHFPKTYYPSCLPKKL